MTTHRDVKRIPLNDWAQIRELACDIANAAGVDDDIMVASRTEALLARLAELEAKHGPCSRITATMADYAATRRLELYQKALQEARDEHDLENEALILESINEIKNSPEHDGRDRA